MYIFYPISKALETSSHKQWINKKTDLIMEGILKQTSVCAACSETRVNILNFRVPRKGHSIIWELNTKKTKQKTKTKL